MLTLIYDVLIEKVFNSLKLEVDKRPAAFLAPYQ